MHDLLKTDAFVFYVNIMHAQVKTIEEGTMVWGQFNAQWWQVPDILPPTGPFHYAFADNTSPQVYLGFSFPGMNGWVQQNFYNITVSAPPKNVFDLPPQCFGTLPSCGFPTTSSTTPLF